MPKSTLSSKLTRLSISSRFLTLSSPTSNHPCLSHPVSYNYRGFISLSHPVFDSYRGLISNTWKKYDNKIFMESIITNWNERMIWWLAPRTWKGMRNNTTMGTFRIARMGRKMVEKWQPRGRMASWRISATTKWYLHQNS